MISHEKNLVKKKVEYFLKNNISVHIVAFSRRFYNGFILPSLTDKYFELEDFLFGKIIIYYSEIKGIEPYVEAKK